MPHRRPLPVPRCARFAGALRRRFAPRTLGVSPAPLLFALRVGRWAAHLRFEARFVLARPERWIARSANRFPSVEKHDPVLVVNRSVTLAQGHRHAAGLSAIALARVERLWTRVVERGVRREDSRSAPANAPRMPLVPAAGVPSANRDRAARERAARERAASMVVARSRVADSRAGEARIGERVSQAAGPALADATHKAAPAAGTRPEPLEHLGELADEVIRRIDRRIAAHRERFGRA